MANKIIGAKRIAASPARLFPGIEITYKTTTSNVTVSFNSAPIVSEDEIRVDWGDGTVNTSTSHKYASAGTYVARITGRMTAISNPSGLRMITDSCITKVVFNSSVDMTLGSYLVASTATALKEVVFGDRITAVGDGQQVFAYQAPIETVRFLCRKCETLGANAFDYPMNYPTRFINIPNGCKVIPDYCYGDLRYLPRLQFPEGIETIGDHAFFYCCTLTEIRLPSTVKEIGQRAFGGCSGIITADLSKTQIELLDQDVFWDSSIYGSNALKNLYLPKTLQRIEKSSFSGCQHIEVIKCYATTPPSFLNGVPSLSGTVVRVPSSALTAYRNSSWNGAAAITAL